ncbi:MAG: GreA/GreB family elongation factor [Eubacteriales bacterium]|nr:GreA/GreB family elongation factor [Eubacteriales bacterium]
MIEKLTKKDIQKIEEEIKHRKLVIRPKALSDLKSARAQGDLSENFEYYAAKKFNRENNSRIMYLEKMIKNAQIIDYEEKDGEVCLNDIIKIKILEDNTIEEYKITTSIRGDSVNGRISIESPLGKSCLGKKVGDIVTINISENFNYNIEIISIVKDKTDDSIRQF